MPFEDVNDRCIDSWTNIDFKYWKSGGKKKIYGPLKLNTVYVLVSRSGRFSFSICGSPSLLESLFLSLLPFLLRVAESQPQISSGNWLHSRRPLALGASSKGAARKNEREGRIDREKRAVVKETAADRIQFPSIFCDGEMLRSSPRPRSRSIESSGFSLLGCDSTRFVSKLQIVKLHPFSSVYSLYYRRFGANRDVHGCYTTGIKSLKGIFNRDHTQYR